MRRDKRGFTIIELLAVATIIALLAVFIGLLWVLPQIIDAIVSGDTTLPVPIITLMKIREFLLSVYGVILAVILVAGIYVFNRWRRHQMADGCGKLEQSV